MATPSRPRELSTKSTYHFRSAVTASLLFGCSTATANLALQPHVVASIGATAQSERPSVASGPPVYVAPVVDQRLDPESLGRAGNRAFIAKAVPQWLDAALRAGIEKRLPVATR